MEKINAIASLSGFIFVNLSSRKETQPASRKGIDGLDQGTEPDLPRYFLLTQGPHDGLISRWFGHAEVSASGCQQGFLADYTGYVTAFIHGGPKLLLSAGSTKPVQKKRRAYLLFQEWRSSTSHSDRTGSSRGNKTRGSTTQGFTMSIMPGG